MQHERVRELKTGGFHWVGTHTGDCRTRGCEAHATELEARECQYEHELANAHEMTFHGARACKECKALGKDKVWTDKALSMGGYMGEIVHLCDEHRTVEVLRKHTEPPFERWVS